MLELARRDGLFGPIRIMERQSDRARLYLIGHSIQTMVRPDGVSVFGYVHAAKLLLAAAHTVLLIGGAGASLATMLARAGKTVTVVDIDPASEELARKYFDLDARVCWVTADALDFIAAFSGVFDGIVIDACDADGLVHTFRDAATLASLLRRARPTGSLVVNLVREDGAPHTGRRLVHALAARRLAATLYSAEDGWEGNEVLHVRTQGETETFIAPRLHERPAEARTYLMSLRPFTPRRKHTAQ